MLVILYILRYIFSRKRQYSSIRITRDLLQLSIPSPSLDNSTYLKIIYNTLLINIYNTDYNKS